MAVSKSSHFGPTSGKIGGIVFYMLNGQQVCRTIGYTGKPSKAQLANRQAMSVTIKLLKRMQDFIKIGFELKAKGTTCNSFNLATAYNKKNALKGVYPNIRVDYSKVLLSSGTLVSTEKATMVKTEEGIQISWAEVEPRRNDYYDDLVMVLLHYPLSGRSRSYLNAGKRVDGTCFIPIEDKKQLEEPIEAYLCFKSADGEEISDSMYLGNLNGSPADEQDIKRIAVEAAEYEVIKIRFEQVQTAYRNYRCMNKAEKTEKAFRHIETEYQALQRKLQDHPGKPG